MTDINDVVIRCTVSQIEDIKESFFWKDLKRELGMWKRG